MYIPVQRQKLCTYRYRDRSYVHTGTETEVMCIPVQRQKQVCPFTHHAGILGDGDTVTLVLNLRTRRRSVVSLRPRPLYTWEMASLSRSERFGLEEINLFPLLGFQPRIIQPVAW
jgi:hypothetical protein